MSGKKMLVPFLMFLGSAGLLCAQLSQGDSWQGGPGMAEARYGFPFVELPSGMRLAAGGVVSGGGGFGTGVEVLEAAAASWASVSPLPSAHRGLAHGVQLLSGELLIAGEDPHVGTHPHPRSAYRYNEASSTWTRTANDPTIDRFSATLTRLLDGRVLFAGGYSGHSSGPTYRSAEIYYPATDTWAATGDMASVRTGHSATLLTTGPNAGKVLVVGGSDRAASNVATSGCELFDTSSGTWSATGSLNESRSLHTATTLPSGAVLVVGGQYILGSGNRISTEIYDPVSGTWTSAASMPVPRANHSATLLLSGQVFVAGGATGPGTAGTLSRAEIYEPDSDSWSAAASMSTARLQHSAALLPDGRVIVVGGLSGGTILSSTEIYDPGVIGVELMSFTIE